ncbi:unnamed protein product, partial [marine sediment metagenome]
YASDNRELMALITREQFCNSAEGSGMVGDPASLLELVPLF